MRMIWFMKNISAGNPQTQIHQILHLLCLHFATTGRQSFLTWWVLHYLFLRKLVPLKKVKLHFFISAVFICKVLPIGCKSPVFREFHISKRNAHYLQALLVSNYHTMKINFLLHFITRKWVARFLCNRNLLSYFILIVICLYLS